MVNTGRRDQTVKPIRPQGTRPDPASAIAANTAHTSCGSLIAGDTTLDDVLREVGDRWQVSPITGGYRAVIRDAGGHIPIPRYGRTPGELLESIRMAERQA